RNLARDLRRQRDREALGALHDRTVEDRNREGLGAAGAGREGNRAGARGVVRAGMGRAVGGGVVELDIDIAGAGAGDREGHGAGALVDGDVADRDRVGIVVGVGRAWGTWTDWRRR